MGLNLPNHKPLHVVSVKHIPIQISFTFFSSNEPTDGINM